MIGPGLLPWEKLPHLILGPFMIAVGFGLIIHATSVSPNQAKEIFWGIVAVAIGVAVSIYGGIKAYKKMKLKADK